MAVYRNQTNTMSQITMLSRMRITNTQEAVAFLRAIQPLQEQVAAVLQTQSLKRQQTINKEQIKQAPAPAPKEEKPVQEPDKPFVPEDLSSDEGYTESEIEARVEKLKKAKK